MRVNRRDFGLMAGAAGLASRAAAAEVIAGACDCHHHIVGPPDRYPMDPKRLYTPPQASVDELLAQAARLGVTRHVTVQPSFYGTDNRCMLDAVARLGRNARGIAVVDEETVTDAELRRLHAGGVRGVRLNIETAGGTDSQGTSRRLERLAPRLKPLGWLIQIYADVKVLAAMAPTIAGLGVPVVFDHFGSPHAALGVDQPGFGAVLDLVRRGHAYVKLGAPYRISDAAPDYADVVPIMKALIAANPDRMLWASDWPHTQRWPGLPATAIHPFLEPDDEHIFALFKGWAGGPAMVRRILVDNPARLYGF
jgi:predicted TIM-barrel fold metal-dependent hydrolase